MSLVLVSIVFVTGGVLMPSDDSASIDDVLEQYQETCEGRRSCYIRSQTFREMQNDSSGKVVRDMGQNELFREHSLIDLYMDNFRPVGDANEASVRPFRREQQLLWNGSTRFDIHNNEVQDRSYAFLRHNRPPGDNILAHAYFGSPLEGYFLGDDEDILTILRDEASSTTRGYRTTLNRATCYVIEADIKNRGRYKAWFDPAHGYSICHAEVARTVGETYHGDRTSPTVGRQARLAAVRFVLYDVSFKKSRDVWFPLSGHWQVTKTYDNGDSRTVTFHHQCVELECGRDDFRFAEAFVPQIRDGTVVFTEGRSPLLRDEWMHGRAEPVIDWRVVKTTDKVMDEYTANVKQRGATISLMRASSTTCDPEVACQSKSEKDFTDDHKTKTRAHCGLYCIYAAVRASGTRIDFGELLKPEYIGSVRGSSLLELKTAAQDHGLYAEAVQKLTTTDLKACTYCSILHVKRDFKSATYNHYVLFLGMEDGKAVLFDAPNLRRVALSDIGPLWGGTCLVLASQPVNVAHLVARGRVRFIVCSAMVLSAVTLVCAARRSFVSSWGCSVQNRLCLSTVQAVGLGVAALVISLGNHWASDTGMLTNVKVTKSMQQAHSGDFLWRIGFQHAKTLLADGAVFVDARFRRDYEAGHVPGAMSIPFDANESQYENMIARIPRDLPIVVYCQSANCAFAGEIASKLTHDSFQNVQIFRGGWYEWSTRNDIEGSKKDDPVRHASPAK